MKPLPDYPKPMNEAVAAPMAGRFVGSPLPDATADKGIFGAHRGPLEVDDNFAVLDDPIEQREFTEFAEVDGQPMAESVLMVQGMYCAACADTVECALQGVPGVESAQVHAATRRLTLRWDPAVTRISNLAQVVGQTGYRLLPMQHALSISERLRETRQALWRLFVAGFCAMQVMMYAVPAYVTAPGEFPPISISYVAVGKLVVELACGVLRIRSIFQERLARFEAWACRNGYAGVHRDIAELSGEFGRGLRPHSWSLGA
ncbi:MAG: cation transporter [Burkholderiaceae bacterium]